MDQQRHVVVAAGLAAAALVLSGCGDAKLPLQPAPLPVSATLEEFSLSGEVYDSASRSLSGVKVEVIDGPRSGTATTTDEAGRFSMPGPFIGVIQVTASKDGYVPATGTFAAHFRQVFSLEPLGQSANVAGLYTLTLTADSACSDLPVEARVRTYSATIAPAFASRTRFRAAFTDGRFFSIHHGASVLTASDFASVVISIPEANTYEWPGIVEELGETTYLAIEGRGGGTFDGTGMTAAFDGSFQFCPLETALTGDRYGACPAGRSIQCDSKNHRLTLVRR